MIGLDLSRWEGLFSSGKCGVALLVERAVLEGKLCFEYKNDQFLNPCDFYC